jgi:hypothetical protein
VFDPRRDHVRFVVDKVALGQGFLRVLRFSHLSVILPTFRSYFHLHVILTKINERTLGGFQNAMLYRKSGSIGYKKRCHLVFVFNGLTGSEKLLLYT